MYWIIKTVLFLFIVSSGLSEKPPLHGEPLKNGEATLIEKVPYHASMLYYGWIFLCSGIIISERIVLTAAHCTMGNPTQWLVQVGSHHKSEDGEKYAIETIIIHEQYYTGNSDMDLGLFIVKDYMTIDGITTVIIPLVPPHYEIPDDVNEGVTSAWGSSGNPNVTDPLKTIHYKILPHSECVEAFTDNEKGIKISENVLCAGIPEEKCEGDSGQPLVIDCFLVGMASYPVGCAGSGLPGIYVKMSAAYTWIQDWIDNPDKATQES